ncbi:MAG: HD domain-containing protein [Thermoplasmatota archaeon]
MNTDLCEVLALCHDIGHPPYSHHGERVLNRIMKEVGVYQNVIVIVFRGIFEKAFVVFFCLFEGGVRRGDIDE